MARKVKEVEEILDSNISISKEVYNNFLEIAKSKKKSENATLKELVNYYTIEKERTFTNDLFRQANGLIDIYTGCNNINEFTTKLSSQITTVYNSKEEEQEKLQKQEEQHQISLQQEEEELQQDPNNWYLQQCVNYTRSLIRNTQKRLTQDFRQQQDPDILHEIIDNLNEDIKTKEAWLYDMHNRYTSLIKSIEKKRSIHERFIRYENIDKSYQRELYKKDIIIYFLKGVIEKIYTSINEACENQNYEEAIKKIKLIIDESRELPTYNGEVEEEEVEDKEELIWNEIDERINAKKYK